MASQTSTGITFTRSNSLSVDAQYKDWDIVKATQVRFS